MAALSAGHLVQSHMKHNRKKETKNVKKEEPGDCIIS